MRGSIRKRKGSYQVRWHLGEGHYKAKSFTRKKEAEKFLSQVVSQVHEGTYREIKPINFEAFSNLWLKTHGPNLRESTYSLYEGMIRVHFVPFFGKSPLTAIGIDDIQRLLSEKGQTSSPATVHSMRRILVKMFNHAKKWGYLKENPARETEPPQIPYQEMSYLTPQEADKFISFLKENDPSYFCLFQTALQTGLRLGELLALKWEDIEAGIIRVKRQIHKGRISEPKSKRGMRQVPIPKALEKALKEHKLASRPSSEGWVFPSEAGTPINGRNLIRRHFEPALKASGVKKIRFHDLRHSYGAHLVAAGVHAKAIQEALGHASIKTTLDRYGHLMPSAFSQVAEALDKVHQRI